MMPLIYGRRWSINALQSSCPQLTISTKDYTTPFVDGKYAYTALQDVFGKLDDVLPMSVVFHADCPAPDCCAFEESREEQVEELFRHRGVARYHRMTDSIGNARIGNASQDDVKDWERLDD